MWHSTSLSPVHVFTLNYLIHDLFANISIFTTT